MCRKKRASSPSTAFAQQYREIRAPANRKFANGENCELEIGVFRRSPNDEARGERQLPRAAGPGLAVLLSNLKRSGE